MRKYKKEKTTTTHDVLIETRCDLCKAIAKHGDWSSGAYDVNETEIKVTIRQKEGESYPEGGNGTSLIVDICPKCFKEVLIPFLREKGADIKEEEWEWEY